MQRQQDVTNLQALELQVTTAVRDAARQVDTNLKRVEATRKAREFAERRYEAEQKRMTVGLSTTFQLFQAQRDLSQQQLAGAQRDDRLQPLARRLRSRAARAGERTIGQPEIRDRGSGVTEAPVPRIPDPGPRPSRTPVLDPGPPVTLRPVTKLTVTVITRNESAHISPRRSQSVAWADEIIVIDSGSTDDTVAIARRHATRVEVRDWPGYSAQKNYAAALASHDWILSLDADERVTPALAAEIRALLEGEPAARGYRMPRVTYYLGRWIRSTDWYPDYQLRLYDRRAGRWNGRRVHESVDASERRSSRAAPPRAAALRLPRHLPSPRDDRSLHDARRGAVARRRPPDRGVAAPRPSAGSRSCATTSCAAAFTDGGAGLHRLGAQLVLRVPEAGEAVGAAAGGRQTPRQTPTRRRRIPARSLDPGLMFSLHIDTARTWRGGQNQVLVTVLGLRALGHRTMLVAHPGGELRQRAAEGLDLIPLAPKTEMDLSAAWRLSRAASSSSSPTSSTRTIRTASRWRRWRCR